MADGQIVFEISADGKSAVNSVKNVTHTIESESKKWDSAAGDAANGMSSKLVSAFKSIGAAAIAAKVGQTLFKWGEAAVSAASDLQEVQNVVDTTFGESASTINAWAKNATTQFGLTETQAKRFTSTLGAMMKSAGLAGPEIVGMSQDLAGLAADMASFYNMDFETAFQKIRSGISGETEPLKQLGINMSVANLEAYALTQGITKSFDKMSQGEQTMIRYQYLMQATADAQGDFARTSDGYANSLRRIQTAIDTLKTKAGEVLLDIVNPLAEGLAGLLEDLTQNPNRTVIDTFNEIDIDTAQKIADIQAVAKEAGDLIKVMDKIAAPKESQGLTEFVNAFSGSLVGLEAPLSAAKTNDYNGTISGMADALSKQLGGSPTKWKNLLNAIGNNAGAAVDAVSGDDGKVATFLSGVADESELGDYSNMWKKLLGVLGDKAGAAILALAGGDNTGEILASIASGSSGVQDKATVWKNLLGAIKANGGGAVNALKDGANAGEVLESIAGGADDLTTDNSGSWSNLLDAVKGKAKGAINALKGGENSGNSLSSIADGADDLTGDNSAAWSNIFDAVKGKAKNAIDALKGGENSGKTLESIAGGADDLINDNSSMWANLLAAFAGDGTAALQALTGNASSGRVLIALALGANVLDASSPGTWESLLGILDDVDGISVLGNANAGGNIESLATALSGASPDTDKAAAWKTFLDALGSNTDALSKLTGASAEETGAWLEGIATAADSIDPNDTAAWSELMGALVSGLPGMIGEAGGEEFLQQVTKNLLALGTDSAEATTGLLALGYTTEEIEYKQQEWLQTCNRLVSTIPGLSSIVNTETGAIKGGTEAVKAYVDEWKRSQEAILLWKAHFAKQAALAENEGSIYALRLDVITADVKVEDIEKELREKFEKAFKGVISDEDYNYLVESGIDAMIQYAETNGVGQAFLDEAQALDEVIDRWRAADFVRTQATEKWQKQADAQAEKTEELNKEEEALERTIGEYEDVAKGATDATKDLEEATTTLGKAAQGDVNSMKEVTEAVDLADKALEALDATIKDVRKSTEDDVKRIVEGFNEIETPAQKARRELKDLTDELNGIDTSTEDGQKAFDELNRKINETGNAAPTATKMLKNLESQLQYMRDYQSLIAQARAAGVSEDVLSYLSDGSEESFDYLYALVNTNAGEEQIAEINYRFAEVEKERQKFVDDLTAQKLKADETYQGIVKTAEEAIANLNLGEEAKDSVVATVQGIVDGLGKKKSEVETQVNAILATIERLGEYGSFSLGVGGIFSWFLNGSHADGLDYVPFDHYLAELHEGESILTAEEAKVWRNFKYGQASSRNVDYGAMAGAIWDNAPNMGGGNVYLDGQTVGRVISARQADSYRALERSGWQR